MGDKDLDTGTILSICEYIDKNGNLSPKRLYAELTEMYDVDPNDILDIIKGKKGENYKNQINMHNKKIEGSNPNAIKPNKLEKEVLQAPAKETQPHKKRKIWPYVVIPLAIAALAVGCYFFNKNYQENKRQEKIRIEQIQEERQRQIFEAKRETVDVYLEDRICRACNGSGGYMCLRCNGSGTVDGTDAIKTHLKTETCRNCKGMGEVSTGHGYVKCYVCKGQGNITTGGTTIYEASKKPCPECSHILQLKRPGYYRCDGCGGAGSQEVYCTVVRDMHSNTIDTIMPRFLKNKAEQ